MATTLRQAGRSLAGLTRAATARTTEKAAAKPFQGVRNMSGGTYEEEVGESFRKKKKKKPRGQPLAFLLTKAAFPSFAPISANTNMWRNVTFVCLPVIVGLTAYIFSQSHAHGHEQPAYSYLQIRNKDFPWGESFALFFSLRRPRARLTPLPSSLLRAGKDNLFDVLSGNTKH